MLSKIHKPKRLAYALTALGTALAMLAPAVLGGVASAGIPTPRLITMSSSAPGTTTAGQNVSYAFSLTPATTGTQGIVIDFCDSSPIIGGACTNNPPTGMSLASAALTTGTNTTNWTLSSHSGGTLKLNKNTGSALTTTASTFTITGITNPTNTGTFYARIYTFNTTTYTGYTSITSVSGYLDAGGVALSVTNLITISATVQESLVFCVSKAAPTTQCGGTTSPALTIGNGGSPNVLDTSTVRTDTAYSQVSTNAINGATVTMAAFNNAGTTPSCAGLSKDGGSTCPIAAIGAFAAMTAGTGKFGLNVANGSPLGGTGSGSAPANANYGTTAGSYGLNDAAVRNGTGGDTIYATAGAACNDVNTLLTFGATAAPTTPAGVYSANESLIATGSF